MNRRTHAKLEPKDGLVAGCQVATLEAQGNSKVAEWAWRNSRKHFVTLVWIKAWVETKVAWMCGWSAEAAVQTAVEEWSCTEVDSIATALCATAWAYREQYGEGPGWTRFNKWVDEVWMASQWAGWSAGGSLNAEATGPGDGEDHRWDHRQAVPLGGD